MDPSSPQQAREAELALVSRLRAGDAAAFDAVHTAFNTRIFNFLARLSRRRDVAEDLLEETWLRVVDRADRLRPDTELGPFLFTVARNLYVSYCRSRMLEDAHAPGMTDLWPAGTSGPSPYESTLANETEHRIEMLLASLPATYREALLLVAYEGMRPSEAAAVCGISAEAMRQRVSRARALLARQLNDAQAPAILALKEVIT
jgi:RNA polymerase sigma-70 factor (ECF subfamily)